jgi:catechol 2,3-dioxygenase-like lactoylglutathione lyase family enzyme
MQLTFQFQPVTDLAAAATFYRELGWEEAWREGETTIAFQMPGVETQLMLDNDAGWSTTAGPMYLVDDLLAWLEAHPELPVAIETSEIPGGRVAGIGAPDHVFYVFSMDDAEG